MATKIVIGRDGVVRGVYDDRFKSIFEALGVVKIERASNVEYDHATSEWVATLVSTGEEIARGKDRSKVIEQEVAYLEARL